MLSQTPEDNMDKTKPPANSAGEKMPTSHRSQVTMIATMATMGMAPAAIAALAAWSCELHGTPMAIDTRRYLQGPIIVHADGGWRDVIPKWMFPQIIAERVEIAMGDSPYPIVGPTEIAAVMMPATLAHPLHRDAAELYCWAGARAAARHYGKPIEEYEQMLGPDNGNMRQPSDKDVIQRGGRLWEDYRSLADEIRRKVVAQARVRDRDHREVTRSPGKPRVEAAPPVVVGEQLSFFAKLKARLDP